MPRKRRLHSPGTSKERKVGGLSEFAREILKKLQSQWGVRTPQPGERVHTMAKGLTYHQGDTEVEVIKEVDSDDKSPVIVFSPQAQETIGYILALTDDDYEIGFLGTVDIIDRDYVIGDIFIPPQEAGVVHCEMTEKGLALLFTKLLKEKGKDYVNKIMFWGHVHPGGVTASGQDDDQMSLFRDNPWFIRGIFDRTGDTKIDFYDYKKRLCYLDCWFRGFQWNYDAAKKIESDIKKNIKKEKENYRSRTHKSKKSDGADDFGYENFLGPTVRERELPPPIHEPRYDGYVADYGYRGYVHPAYDGPANRERGVRGNAKKRRG